ncbi:MAG: DUF4876 domain-containing protein [Bacteroidales bacterium]|jgi:hypothetical protein|nr:DUF4876 domain-containing protein [Bacteroidales bacterium]MCI2121628.1 DUF4876 domain-containing protein [Bacteroidales bacterium]MCI2146272.1 DUF4876 domain-containing protein [Bacteroidales bacterium]
MKKSALIAVALIAAFALTSCEKTKKVTLISAVAQLNVSSITDISVPSSFDVVFTNYDTKVAVTATSIDNEASVSNLTPGIYTVTATAISSKDGSAYNFSGSATNVSITEEGQVIPVDVAVVKSSALIFKELYWTGDVTPADPTTGKTSNYFRDQYYEIYNNSQATVYADSLCICTLVPMQSTANSYSWQIDNPENYVFTQLIWQLPGNGTDYPVKPGESIIIAQWGVDHTAEGRNPNSNLDLSGADFEAYVGTNATLVDGAALNMNRVVLIGYSAPQWLATVFGPAYVLFYPSEPLENDNFIQDANSSSKSREIPVKDVLDAVEFVKNEASVSLKRVPTVLDAGALWADSYSGTSFYRKTKETLASGQVIYQDTNNSTNDFETGAPVVRRNGAGVPSWNTWIKQ